MIGTTISHYHILDKLGEGGMGVVYAAEDAHLGRRVAIKFPHARISDDNFRARFLREARAASALSHPRIAAVYDYGETPDGQPFTVMELVRGQSLGEMMSAGTLTLRRGIEIVEGIAEALAEAHRHGVIHRDIKPSNVMVNESGEVKVLDFGLAKRFATASCTVGSDDAAQTLPMPHSGGHTASGVILGTPVYLSPEQATGAPVDGRSDLFSLGALLYETIAGRPPFTGANAVEICAQVIHIEPPPPSSFNRRVPPALDRIVLKALTKRPAARYQSADELLADLRATYDSLSAVAADHTPTRRVRPASGTLRLSALTTIATSVRRPRVAAALVLSVVAVALFAAWGWMRTASHTGAHQPSAEAHRWYERGTSAMRDGAYYQASKSLEQAVANDDRFAIAHAALAQALSELDYSDKAKTEMLRAEELMRQRSSPAPADALYFKAVNATVRRDFPAATSAFADLARLSPDDAQVYVDLGIAHEKNEQPDEAIVNYLEALRRAGQYPTPYLRLGVLYSRKQDSTAALAAFDKAEAMYGSLSNYEGVAETLYQRGFTLLNAVGKPEDARSTLQKALDITRTTNNLYQEIKTRLLMSSVSCFTGDTAQAQQQATEAVNLARADDLQTLTARGLTDIGTALFARGNYAEADRYFMQSLELARRYKLTRSEARASLALGSLRVSQGKKDEGVNYIKQALMFYQPGNYHREIMQAQYLIGVTERQKGNYDSARQAFEEQLKVAQLLDDSKQMINAQDGLGNVLLIQGHFPAALKLFQGSLSISIAQHDRMRTSYSLSNCGAMLWRLGRYTEAREMLDRAAALANRSGGNSKLAAAINLQVADAMLREGYYAEAIAKSRQALSSIDEQDVGFKVEAMCVLGLAQSLSGAKRKGKQICEAAEAVAVNFGDPLTLLTARLALAEAMIEDGDAAQATRVLLPEAWNLQQTGRNESAWQAWLFVARAYLQIGDLARAREGAANSRALLVLLEQEWGTESYKSYLTRRDVSRYRKQLDQIIT